jgi:peptidoglycan/xylan/chitin deacetylase (PgdA/CDA1 family)
MGSVSSEMKIHRIIYGIIPLVLLLLFLGGCQGVYFRVQTEEKIVALTFDDGPHPVYTPRVLEILETFGVKATFFLIGRQARSHPEVVQQIKARGHEIENHSDNHLFYLPWLPAERMRQEIVAAQETIYRVTGSYPKFFRSPLGWVSNDLVAVCRELKLPIINGSVKASDVSLPGTEYIIQTVLDKTRNGAIIILHDAGGVGLYRDRTQTIEALPIIIQNLKERGYKFVILKDLIDVV